MPYAFRKDFTKVNLPYSSYGYNVYSEISPGESQDYVFDLADFGDSSSAGGASIVAIPNYDLGQNYISGISIETYTELVVVEGAAKYRGHIILHNGSQSTVHELQVDFFVISRPKEY